MAMKLGVMNLKNFGGYISTPWKSAFITVIVVLVVGFLTINSIQNKPSKPIVIDDSNLSLAEVQTLASVLSSVGEVQFFSADLDAIRDEVTKLSWVERADVSRDWYRGVVVSVVPRKAIANFGSKQMVDANGQVFVPVDTSTLMNAHLTTLHGHETMAFDIMTQMNRINTWFEPLGIQIKELNLTPRQTWVIRFNNDLRVVVDRENTDQKLYNLPKILFGHYKDKLSQIQSVDLRYKNGFVIAWKSRTPTDDGSTNK